MKYNRQTIVLKLEYHVIWYCLYCAFLLFFLCSFTFGYSIFFHWFAASYSEIMHLSMSSPFGGGGGGRATHENLTGACISVGILIILIFQLQRVEGK